MMDVSRKLLGGRVFSTVVTLRPAPCCADLSPLPSTRRYWQPSASSILSLPQFQFRSSPSVRLPQTPAKRRDVAARRGIGFSGISLATPFICSPVSLIDQSDVLHGGYRKKSRKRVGASSVYFTVC